MPLPFPCRPTALILAAFGLMAPVTAQAEQVTVFATASLTNAATTLAHAWSEQTGHQATMSFAGSSALARQIQHGAPADIFISASTDWMDAVETSGDLRAGTRRDILGNTLVLIAHGTDVAPVTLDETLDLAGMVGDARLAMALVDAVPAGVYGKAALTSLGLWDNVAPQVAQADNVRAALAFVAQNEAPFGIVFATDAAVADTVSVIGTFPEGSHPAITYPAAITAQSTSPVAQEFLEFLSSDTARAIWHAYGFSVLD
ncbi:molybdate transport system substrate-binding protein [Roseinatronobacter thiooxidans]|uniref:Molybdate transport system substrate-binding protein n=2 Tax=Roseinatronobacter thiooxidans TaxID=121821 RepID=A0A2W7S5X6_9RHOB|nr:molybdate ABC transporter substrate-binding protein [Roseinatronobacter thiooxidans]PZX45932.1 molybdate transport system substrate-binding protein [Roseinatronobacter thiooxidans]